MSYEIKDIENKKAIEKLGKELEKVPIGEEIKIKISDQNFYKKINKFLNEEG